MTQAIALERQQHLGHLLPWLRDLCRVVEDCAAGPESAPEMLGRVLTCECIQCGICLPGSDVVAFALADPEPRSDLRLKRLEHGYCARKGCDSYYYRVSFSMVPGLNWAELVRLAESGQGSIDHFPLALERRALWQGLTLDWRWVARGAGILGGATLLWVALQCYRGGTVPLLRQPEVFVVDRTGEAGPEHDGH